jgi:hypothetical protein
MTFLIFCLYFECCLNDGLYRINNMLDEYEMEL